GAPGRNAVSPGNAARHAPTLNLQGAAPRGSEFTGAQPFPALQPAAPLNHRAEAEHPHAGIGAEQRSLGVRNNRAGLEHKGLAIEQKAPGARASDAELPHAAAGVSERAAKAHEGPALSIDRKAGTGVQAGRLDHTPSPTLAVAPGHKIAAAGDP